IFYGDVLEIVAGVFFFIGTTMVTIIKNVPLNERLKNTIGDAALTQLWRHYLRVWTRWNHVRTISSIIAVVLMFVD
ncbi:MAG: anthrone oxygenase family protein, partial [Pseudomonadota bacterium]